MFLRISINGKCLETKSLELSPASFTNTWTASNIRRIRRQCAPICRRGDNTDPYRRQQRRSAPPTRKRAIQFEINKRSGFLTSSSFERHLSFHDLNWIQFKEIKTIHWRDLASVTWCQRFCGSYSSSSRKWPVRIWNFDCRFLSERYDVSSCSAHNQYRSWSFKYDWLHCRIFSFLK